MEDNLQEIRHTIFVVLAVALVLVGASEFAGQNRVIEGTYVNPNYGYSVKIPNGIRGETLAPPAPQHGFGVDLNRKSKGSIWVDGSYDSSLLGSADALARDTALEFAKKYNLTVASNVVLKFSELEARDVVLENVAKTGTINYIHFILAFRKRVGQPGIVYTIGILEDSKDASAENLYSRIVNSFRLTRLPN